MSIRPRLDQRQTQRLILAPALQQAIKLLPLTNLELVQVIDAELEQNPFLELVEEEPGQSPGEEQLSSTEGAKAAPAEADGTSDSDSELLSRDDEFRDGAELAFQEYIDDGLLPRFSGEKKEAVALENFLTKAPSLQEHLEWQARLTFSDSGDLEIANFIIGDINDDGYLTSSVEELAALCRTSVEKVQSIREKIKAFDPVGVGSLNLNEALLAQMDNLGIKEGAAREIVANHLLLFERSDYAQLSKVLNLSPSEIRPHVHFIRSLDPKPGRRYAQETTNYIVPDIVVTKEGDEWSISLNDEGVPRLRLNQYYRRQLSEAQRTQPEAYAFLKENWRKAIWFLRSLDQRDRTIYKVARCVVEKQKEFFEKGIEHLRPMVLSEVAREVGVHESTVARVVANKHIQTAQGVFALNYFFHKSIPSDQGDDISSIRIKDLIRRIVGDEDRANPLSDIDIKQVLERVNIRIARRTVAKYREQLGIEPSHIRKRKHSMEEGSA